MRVLIVDDDERVRAILKEALEDAGAEVEEAGTVGEMRRTLRETSFDLITLDIGLPDEDGIVALKTVRLLSDAHVIMITGRSELPDVVKGLNEGADDYVTKPFKVEEVVARARAASRRRKEPRTRRPPATLSFDGFIVDTVRCQVITPEGAPAPLTGAEFRLLTTFLSRPNVTLSRDELRSALGKRPSAFEDRSLDMLVRRLRAKIEPEPNRPRYIKTLRGQGYLFAAPVLQG